MLSSDQKLALDQPRAIAFAADPRSDLVLLEVDEGLVSEILQSGWGRPLRSSTRHPP